MRPWAPADARTLLAIRAAEQARLAPWIPWGKLIPTLDEQLAQILLWNQRFWSGSDLTYALFERDGAPVGAVGVHDRCGPHARELGYWLTRDGEGRGYMSEAVRAMTRLAFELYGLDRLEVHTDPANSRSRAIPERLGFTHELTLKRRVLDSDGQLADSVVYTLYHPDYLRLGLHTTPVLAVDALGRRLL